MSVVKVTSPRKIGLDEVHGYFEDIEKGVGRVTLICYNMAWTAWWGGIGDRSVMQFFKECGVDYLEGKFGFGTGYKMGPYHRKWVSGAVESMHNHLNIGDRNDQK